MIGPEYIVGYLCLTIGLGMFNRGYEVVDT